MKRKPVRKLATTLATMIIVFFVIALGLIFSESVDSSPGSDSVDLSEATGVDYSDLPKTQRFAARDGTELAYRRYESARQTNRVLILVHGSAWHGMQFHAMAGELAARGVATVIAPDMRGHGEKPVRRGDVDHSGQLEEDMADLIGHVSEGVSSPEIILGGHSSGGGFVVRFAGGTHAAKADAFILLAPFLKYNAPTTRENSGGWARPATRRIIGLAMLNMVGITALNHLDVIGFAMPQFVLSGPYGYTATRRYTYRMTSAFAPRPDYEGDLAAIDKPLLVVAGDRDEAFIAEQFEPVISAQTKTGVYHVLPGVSHMGIIYGAEVLPIIEDWLGGLSL